jgi:hypothetical protein
MIHSCLFRLSKGDVIHNSCVDSSPKIIFRSYLSSYEELFMFDINGILYNMTYLKVTKITKAKKQCHLPATQK